MNVHQNAKLTRAGRALLVERLLAGERTEDVARERGVSRRTAFKWKKRYREEGEAGLEDRSRTVDGAGWELLHVCVDDATRVAYAEVGPDEKGATAAGFLQRAAAWFERQGVTIERVMTDNGSCYRSKVFRRAVEGLQARHIFNRPYTPRTNGKAERFIRTAKELWTRPGPTDTRMSDGPSYGPSSTSTTASGPTGEPDGRRPSNDGSTFE